MIVDICMQDFKRKNRGKVLDKMLVAIEVFLCRRPWAAWRSASVTAASTNATCMMSFLKLVPHEFPLSQFQSECDR